MRLNYFCSGNHTSHRTCSINVASKLNRRRVQANQLEFHPDVPSVISRSHTIGDIHDASRAQIELTAELRPRCRVPAPAQRVEPGLAIQKFEAHMPVLEDAYLRSQPDAATYEDRLAVSHAKRTA